MQAGMLGRVAITNDHGPGFAYHVECVAILQSPVAVGHLRNAPTEATKPRFVSIDLCFGPTRAAIKAGARFRRFAARIRHQHSASYVLKPAHPEFGTIFTVDPTRIAHMVRMHMRHDHPIDRPSLAHLVYDLAPGLFGLRQRHARINDRPTIAIIDKPEIDPFQRERQRHTHPVNSGSNLLGVPHLRRIFAPGISEPASPCRFAFKTVHALEMTRQRRKTNADHRET